MFLGGHSCRLIGLGQTVLFFALSTLRVRLKSGCAGRLREFCCTKEEEAKTSIYRVSQIDLFFQSMSSFGQLLVQGHKYNYTIGFHCRLSLSFISLYSGSIQHDFHPVRHGLFIAGRLCLRFKSYLEQTFFHLILTLHISVLMSCNYPFKQEVFAFAGNGHDHYLCVICSMQSSPGRMMDLCTAALIAAVLSQVPLYQCWNWFSTDI